MKATGLLLAAMLAFFLSACAIRPQKGFYEGASALGWSHSVEVGSGGDNVYLPSSKPPFPFAVVFATTVKGSLSMVINYPEERPKFSNADVVVAFDNGKRSVLEAQQSMTMDVAASDAFTITVPAFRLNGVDFPQLEAVFKWNDSTKYYVRSLQ